MSSAVVLQAVVDLTPDLLDRFCTMKHALEEILEHTTAHGAEVSQRWAVETAAKALGVPEPEWIYGEDDSEGQKK